MTTYIGINLYGFCGLILQVVGDVAIQIHDGKPLTGLEFAN